MNVNINDIHIHALKDILSNRREVVKLACQQRAKFEGWLKFELVIALANCSEISNLIIEDSYSSTGRSDYSFVYKNEQYFVEMKTANTNWRVKGIENLHRPVTKNMNGIIEDIQVLYSKSPPAHGIAVFAIFPIPFRLITQTPAQLSFHLDRIERESGLPKDCLQEAMEYVPISDTYGVSVFVVNVV